MICPETGDGPSGEVVGKMSFFFFAFVFFFLAPFVDAVTFPAKARPGCCFNVVLSCFFLIRFFFMMVLLPVLALLAVVSAIADGVIPPMTSNEDCRVSATCPPVDSFVLCCGLRFLGGFFAVGDADPFPLLPSVSSSTVGPAIPNAGCFRRCTDCRRCCCCCCCCCCCSDSAC